MNKRRESDFKSEEENKWGHCDACEEDDKPDQEFEEFELGQWWCCNCGNEKEECELV